MSDNPSYQNFLAKQLLTNINNNLKYNNLNSSSNSYNNSNYNLSDKSIKAIEYSEKLGSLLDVIDSIKPRVINEENKNKVIENKINNVNVNNESSENNESNKNNENNDEKEEKDEKDESNKIIENEEEDKSNSNVEENIPSSSLSSTTTTSTTTTTTTTTTTNPTSSISLTTSSSTSSTTTNSTSSPYDWIKHYDPTHAQFYYYNYKTGVTQWEQPEGFIEPIIITPPPAQNLPITAEAASGYAATFNSRTGSFSSAGSKTYWENVGRPTDREGRQLSAFFNLSDLEKNRAEAKMKKKELQVFD